MNKYFWAEHRKPGSTHWQGILVALNIQQKTKIQTPTPYTIESPNNKSRRLIEAWGFKSLFEQLRVSLGMLRVENRIVRFTFGNVKTPFGMLILFSAYQNFFRIGQILFGMLELFRIVKTMSDCKGLKPNC